MTTAIKIDWLRLANHFRRMESQYWRHSMSTSDPATRRRYRGFSDRYALAAQYSAHRALRQS